MDGFHYEAVFSPADVDCSVCGRVLPGGADDGYVRVCKGRFVLARVCRVECARIVENRLAGVSDAVFENYPFGGRNGFPVQ